MKHLSIRFKITFWFTVFLVAVASITYWIVFSVSNQLLQKTIRDNLIETVEHNVDEIEYYNSIDDVDLTNDVDHFIEYAEGYLEIDDDFLDQVNEVYTALYRENSDLLYGENPIARDTGELKFTDSKIQTIRVSGTLYYIFDRKLTAKGVDGLWLRGVVSEEQGAMQMSAMMRLSLILLPPLLVISIVGGYLLAGRMLRPIQNISDTARKIGQDNDLKKRIELSSGSDELHQLADSFNDMFQRLDEAFETERQFISDASHELRTPTSVIVAQCEYSLEKPRSGQEYEDALRVIQRQGRKMSRLISDMLDFARLESGTSRYPREVIPLTELVESVCAEMALIQEKGIALSFETEADVVCVGNRDLLSRLLSNLIGNAYRYGKENGHIYVQLQVAASQIKLSVSDDGIGIAADDQEKIFHRFYQADNSRSGIGTGLGLSIALEIARFHRGTLTVQSQLDKGSTFTLLLPSHSDQ